MLPYQPRSLAGTNNNNQVSLNITVYTGPPLPSLVLHQQLTISTNTTIWGAALPGVEPGLLRWDFGALTTSLLICGSYQHPTRSQTLYLTREISPQLRFSLPPKLHDSSQYFSPLTPHFLAEAMVTCFTTNDRMTKCYPRPTPILHSYIHPSLTSQASSVEAIIYNQISLDKCQSGLPPLPSLFLPHKFTTWLYMLPSQPRTLAGIVNDNQISLNTALLGHPPLPIWSFTCSLRFQLMQQIGVVLPWVLGWDYCHWGWTR